MDGVICADCGDTGWVDIEDCDGNCNDDGQPCMTTCDCEE